MKMMCFVQRWRNGASELEMSTKEDQAISRSPREKTDDARLPTFGRLCLNEFLMISLNGPCEWSREVPAEEAAAASKLVAGDNGNGFHCQVLFVHLVVVFFLAHWHFFSIVLRWTKTALDFY